MNETQNITNQLCGICHDHLRNKQSFSKLKCGHHFHYDCILKTYMNIKKRQCPYCRGKGGWLSLLSDRPIKYVHKEYYTAYLCPAIIMNGINKGCKCNNNTKNGRKFCGKHKKYFYKNKKCLI